MLVLGGGVTCVCVIRVAGFLAVSYGCFVFSVELLRPADCLVLEFSGFAGYCCGLFGLLYCGGGCTFWICIVFVVVGCVALLWWVGLL